MHTIVYIAYAIEYSVWKRVPDRTRRQYNVGLELGPFHRQRYITKPTVGQGLSFTGSKKQIIYSFIEPVINII